MDRIIDETWANLPQVFIERETVDVKDELDKLKGLSNRFRSSSKVSFQYSCMDFADV